MSTSKSESIYRRALRVIPNGGSRLALNRQPYPFYAASGKGAHVVDVDGNKFLDFNNNYTALIHGHAHPRITDAIIAQAQRGSSFGIPAEPEVQLAEMLVGRTPDFESVRFMNSGSEAVMMAIKVARGFTGKSTLVKCEGAYHGSYDYAEISQAPSPAEWGPERPEPVPYVQGTPKAVLNDVIVIPFNEPDVAKAILEDNIHRIGAILLDPMPNRAGLIPASKEFLDVISAFSKASGALVIKDEVINYRLAFGGTHQLFDIRPDLTTLGKVIGGGLPIGAVAGRADILEYFDSRNGKARVPHTGTFNGNPLSAAAGIAALTLLTGEAIVSLNERGKRARQQLSDAFRTSGQDGSVAGSGSLFRLHMSPHPIKNYRTAYPSSSDAVRLHKVFEHLLANGVLITPNGMGCISTVMEDSDVDFLSQQFLDALRSC